MIKKKNMKIENVVASTEVGEKLILEDLLGTLEKSEYEPDQFPGLVYRMKDPNVASLIFSSGKIVCVGATSAKMAKKGTKMIVEKISEAKPEVDPDNLDIDIQNIVAAIELNEGLNLDELAFQLEGSEYEPEQFPGLVYRIYDPKAVFLLFSSGRVVCAGTKSSKYIKRAIESLEKTLNGVV